MFKVSVIIPTYGKPIFLEKAISSVLNQTLKEIELIVVDDNGLDTEARFLTEKLVNNFISNNNKIIYLKHDKNRNGAAARNTGYKVSKGKYISFLDSDDEYHLTRLKKCYDVMEKSHETVAGVYTGCEFKRKGKTYYIYKKVKEGNFMKKTLACTFMFSTGSNIFVRRKVMEKLNGFDEKFLRHQDYEFLVRLFQKNTLEALPEILVIKNNENFNLPSVTKMINIKEQYLLKFNSIIDNLSLEDKNYIYKNNYISIAEQALKTKQKSIAIEYYSKVQNFGLLSLRQRFRKYIIQLHNYTN
jgi:glycosyltransferase involved in cell wall biosynthesis